MTNPKKPERVTEAGLEGDFAEWLDEVWDVVWDDPRVGGAKQLDKEYGRESHEGVYWDLLEEKLAQINDFLSTDEAREKISQLKLAMSGDNLLERNREFYKILQKGIQVTVAGEDGSTTHRYMRLIDYEHPENNSYIATNQFRVKRSGTESIPDFVLLVNGIPIVVGELKSTAQDADWIDAYKDLKKYERQTPELFVPNLFTIAADEQVFRVGATGAGRDFFSPWRKERDQRRPPEFEVKDAVEDLLKPAVIQDILRHFVFYAKKAGGDQKIIPRYMQYHASHRIMNRLQNNKYDRGLYWHTQGSGKSYTMLYTAVNLLRREGANQILKTPQVVIVVDQDKLRRQMSDELNAVGIEQHHVAQSIRDLQRQLEEGKSEILLTTIHMFQDVDTNIQGNPNTVLLVDEAHRFMEKDLGSKLKAALPDAYHFGFTGTPVRENTEAGRNTFREYSPAEKEGENYHHRYSIREGLKDEVILPVHFTLRHVMEWDIDYSALDEEFDEITEDMLLKERDKIIREHLNASELAELRPRVSSVVEEIIELFEQGPEPNGWKGMVVTPSRKAAALYGEELLKYRDPDDIEVLISENRDPGSHEPFMDKFYTSDEEKHRIVERFKKEDKQPKLLVVCNMLLTGFDAPLLKTIYLDRYLTNHTLLQAIARTNRPAPGKVNGEIVDFAGAFENLEKALDYPEEVRSNAAFDREKLFEEFEQLLEKTMEIFQDIEKSNSSETVNKCLSLLSKHSDKKKDFESNFLRLQDIYETLSPDKRLAEEATRQKYRWLNQVWISYRRKINRRERPDEEIREKTHEILEENVSVDKIKREFPVYKINQGHLEMLGKMEPEAKATEVAHAMTDELNDHAPKNPLYENLSERLRDLLKQWKNQELPDSVFADKAEKLEREYIELQEEAAERELTEAEFAIISLLEEEYDSHLQGDNTAEEIARKIYESFCKNIDTSYEGWRERSGIKKEIRRVIIKTIVEELEQPGLYHAEEFVNQACDYLLENVGEIS